MVFYFYLFVNFSLRDEKKIEQVSIEYLMKCHIYRMSWKCWAAARPCHNSRHEVMHHQHHRTQPTRAAVQHPSAQSRVTSTPALISWCTGLLEQFVADKKATNCFMKIKSNSSISLNTMAQESPTHCLRQIVLPNKLMVY